MNSAIQCVILLACVAICWSAAIKDCQCLKTAESSKLSFQSITDVKEYDPSPYCNKRQVIVKLTDDSSRCLDPKIFTPEIVRKMKARLSKRMSTTTTTKTTTTSAPTLKQ